MTPTKQQFRHRPAEGVWGDCHRAAIATVLDLPLDAVPHFGDGGPDGAEFTRRVGAFLAARGLVALNCLYQSDDLAQVLESVGTMNPGVCYLLGGHSRTGVGHTVVCLGGRVVHDPSLTESGIVGPCDDGFYWITFFGSAAALSSGAAG